MDEIVHLNFRLIRLIGFDMLHTFARGSDKDRIPLMIFYFKDLKKFGKPQKFFKHYRSNDFIKKTCYSNSCEKFYSYTVFKYNVRY